MSNETNSNQRQSVFSDATAVTYDRQFSAIRYSFVNGAGMLKVASIESEFIDKAPKKGEKAFNWTEVDNFLIDHNDAVALLEGIKYLRESEDDIKYFTYKTGNDTFSKEIKMLKPQAVKLLNRKFDNYVIKLAKTSEGEVNSIYHIFQNHVVTFNKDLETTVETDLEVFQRFLEEVIKCSIGLGYHSVRRAGGANAGFKKHKTNRTVTEEIDGESEDTPKKVGSLDDEFVDD